MDDNFKKNVEQCIDSFKKNILNGAEIRYVVKKDSITISTTKSNYNTTITNIKTLGLKSQLDIQTRSLVISYEYNDYEFNIKLFFLEKLIDESLIADDWPTFFQKLEPEYTNLFTKIINNITIAIFKNETGKIISNKSYYLDINKGLMEKKEKLINNEYVITYKLITDSITHVFKMFFKFYDNVTVDELTNFSKFKEIIEKTKYNKYLKTVED